MSRTYQLRVTMDWLDYPVLGEGTCGREAEAQGPSVSAGGAPTYTSQLRLTTIVLAFVDPVIDGRRAYRSARNIATPVDVPTTP